MVEGQLLLWGAKGVGKTTLLAAGLPGHRRSGLLPEVLWDAPSDDDPTRPDEQRVSVLLHWDALHRNQVLPATAEVTDLILPLVNGNRLIVRDIRGGDVRNPQNEPLLRAPNTGVLFIVEWPEAHIGEHLNAVRLALELCPAQTLGLALTKCERGLDADDPHWLGPLGWWREHPGWRAHEDVLKRFGDRVWPTSAYGFDGDGRPACLLDEFGQVVPYNIRPRNAVVPFRWFFKELGVW
jgi:hypothetical protein